MDFSKFKTSDWLKVGGALGMLVFGFFNWVKVEIDGFGGDSGNVFDFFWTGTLPWILVIATGVITFLLATGTMKPGNAPWTLILLIATGLAALLLLIRLIFNPLEGKDEFEALGGDVNRGIGMILSVISGLVAFAGAVLGFKESGGDLRHLTDVNKLKSSFGGGTGASGSSSPPPPPPPPPAPPPPPL